MFFDCMEILPAKQLPPEEFAQKGTRYDRQIALIGKTLQDQIQGINIFLVGAGAIGCEILKTMAMMGLACGPQGEVDLCCYSYEVQGMIHVTDMDTIEKSNLSRQFLFTDDDLNVEACLLLQLISAAS